MYTLPISVRSIGYVDDLIDQIRKSGHNLRIGSVVIGCVAYADDIAVLSASYYKQLYSPTIGNK